MSAGRERPAPALKELPAARRPQCPAPARAARPQRRREGAAGTGSHGPPGRSPPAGGGPAPESAQAAAGARPGMGRPRERRVAAAVPFSSRQSFFRLLPGYMVLWLAAAFSCRFPRLTGGCRGRRASATAAARAAPQLRARPPPGSARRPSAGSRLALTRHPRSARPPPRRPLAPAAAAQQPPPPPAAAGSGTARPGGARRRRRGGKRGWDRDGDGGPRARRVLGCDSGAPGEGAGARHGTTRPPRGGAAPALLPGCRAAQSAPLLRREGRVATRRRRDPDRGGGAAGPRPAGHGEARRGRGFGVSRAGWRGGAELRVAAC